MVEALLESVIETSTIQEGPEALAVYGIAPSSQ